MKHRFKLLNIARTNGPSLYLCLMSRKAGLAVLDHLPIEKVLISWADVHSVWNYVARYRQAEEPHVWDILLDLFPDPVSRANIDAVLLEQAERNLLGGATDGQADMERPV